MAEQINNYGLIDPFDDPGSEQPDAYVDPYLTDNAGLVDPFDEPEAPRESPVISPEMGQITTGTRAMQDIVKEKTDPSTWESIKNVFSGGDRETRASRELPELMNFSGLLSDANTADVLKIAPALTTTFDPSEQADIIQTNFPNIRRQQDEKGNIILFNENTGAYAMVNKPGLSPTDIYQGGAVAAEYYPASALGAGGKSLAKNMLKVGAGSAATETVNQAVQAASGGEFNPEEVGLVAAGGAAFEGIGTILAKALAPIYRNSREVTPEIRESFVQAAAEAGIDPEQITDDLIREQLERAVAATRGGPDSEFGIRYTRGQRSGDTAQLGREERLRGGPSESARREMEGFKRDQDVDIMSARERITANMGEGTPIERPVEAGERVIEGVRSRAGMAERAIDDAYGEVGQASLKRQGQQGLVTRLQRRARADQFDINAETAPMTTRTMGELREMQQFIEDVGNRLPNQSLKHVERWRRRLNKRINGAQGEDLRQMTTLKREFDDYLRRSVDRALFTGDEQALSQLREASDLYAAYRQSFTRQDQRITGAKIKDTAGELIQKMVQYDDIMPEEVINYLFGTSKLGRKKDAARAVVKIRNVVGQDSPEFTSMRQAAFLRLTDPGRKEVFSGTRMLTNLTDAMDNSPTLMNSLFSRPEQAMMMRFAREVRRAQPDPQFPSGTPHGNAGYIADNFGRLMTMLGFAGGGVPGAVVAQGGAAVSQNIGKWRSGRVAAQATDQRRPLARLNLGFIAGTQPGRDITEEVTDSAGEGIIETFGDKGKAL